MSPETIERFWNNVLKMQDGHWVWQGSGTDRKYGRIMINHRNIQATRLSYAIFHGKDLEQIEHLKMVKTCPVKSCVNPLHLVALPR